MNRPTWRSRFFAERDSLWRRMRRLSRHVEAARGARPELGRLRLFWLLVVNWPNLIMTMISRGSFFPRSGFAFPTLLLAFGLFGGLYSGHDRVFDHWFLLPVSIVLVLLSTWAILGVISALFTMPLSESLLSRMESMVHGTGRRLKGSAICRSEAARALAEKREQDRVFFETMRERFIALETRDAEETEDLLESIADLRRGLSRFRSLMRAECLVRHFTETLVIIVGAALNFALLARLLTLLDPEHFEPAEVLIFGDAIYFCITVMTTTNLGDIIPVSGIARCFTVWMEILGVSFMTVLIGAAVDAARGTWRDQPAPGISARRLEKRVIAFVLRVYRDYEDLSRPRREMDDLLDEVALRIRASRTPEKP